MTSKVPEVIFTAIPAPPAVGGGTHILSIGQLSIGWDSVIWLHLATKEAGKCSLDVCPGGRGEQILMDG